MLESAMHRIAVTCGAAALLLIGSTTTARAVPVSEPVSATAAYTVHAWVDARVRANPNTSSATKSWVYAGNDYPATCYVLGEKITWQGSTNNVWILIPLKDGTTGWTTAIAFTGDKYADVNTEC